MSPRGPFIAAVSLGLLAWVPLGAARLPVEVLSAVAAVPALAVARLQEPAAFVAAPSGRYLVLDRRAHTVLTLDPGATAFRPLLPVGYEPGHLLQPAMLAFGGDDILVVLDAPNNLQRIQYFSETGMLVGGFFLPIQGTPQIVLNGQVVSGVGAVAFTGTTFLVNQPSWGSLFAELDTTGAVLRHVGQPRETGYEGDRRLHAALNAGLPIVDPTGGFFFVFQTGIPIFRKYDAQGRLLYERHVEGPEIDGPIQALPNVWRPRPDGEQPLPPALVRAAAADADGRLWITLSTGFTYVYAGDGEKVRVVLFRGAAPLQPSSLFFRRNGRLLVGPDGYEFDPRPSARTGE